MTLRRVITTVAATSAFMAAATPCALALDTTTVPGAVPNAVARTTTVVAAVATRKAVPAVEGAVGDKVGQKLSAVQNTLKAGADTVAAVHDLAG